MRIYTIILALVLLASFGGVNAQAAEMTIDEAYRALPHNRTQFNSSEAKMSAQEVKYLDHLFFVTDLAFRERMVMLKAFHAGRDHLYIETYNKEISNLLGSFEFIDPPNIALRRVEKLIVESIGEQRRFFNVWYDARGTGLYKKLQKRMASHHYVQSSHKKLLQAYGVLKQNYPQEAQHNQQSFFDHLCALDFL